MFNFLILTIFKTFLLPTYVYGMKIYKLPNKLFSRCVWVCLSKILIEIDCSFLWLNMCSSMVMSNQWAFYSDKSNIKCRVMKECIYLAVIDQYFINIQLKNHFRFNEDLLNSRNKGNFPSGGGKGEKSRAEEQTQQLIDV